MTIVTVSALTCPACGGPLDSHSATRCRFCGVALVLPVRSDERFPVSEPVAIHGEIVRLREQLRLDPTRPGIHRRLGLAYQALGLTDDAIRSLTVAVELAPEVISPRLELATLLASQSAAGVPDAFPAAMRHVRQVLALEPNSTDGLLLLARLLTQRGQYREAQTTLSGIVSLPPDEIRRRSIWATLAEAADHERRGDRRGAVAAWRRVAVEAPDLAHPAVASFLSRTRVMVTPAGRRQSMLPQTLRIVLVAAVALLGGILLGLPWPVLVAVVGLPVLLALSRRRTVGAGPDHGAIRCSPTGLAGADLARLLREAELVAARADLDGRQRQLDWADNLAVALPGR